MKIRDVLYSISMIKPNYVNFITTCDYTERTGLTETYIIKSDISGEDMNVILSHIDPNKKDDIFALLTTDKDGNVWNNLETQEDWHYFNIMYIMLTSIDIIKEDLEGIEKIYKMIALKGFINANNLEAEYYLREIASEFDFYQFNDREYERAVNFFSTGLSRKGLELEPRSRNF